MPPPPAFYGFGIGGRKPPNGKWKNINVMGAKWVWGFRQSESAHKENLEKEIEVKNGLPDAANACADV